MFSCIESKKDLSKELCHCKRSRSSKENWAMRSAANGGKTPALFDDALANIILQSICPRCDTIEKISAKSFGSLLSKMAVILLLKIFRRLSTLG